MQTIRAIAEISMKDCSFWRSNDGFQDGVAKTGYFFISTSVEFSVFFSFFEQLV
jgi:hypothetical protein